MTVEDASVLLWGGRRQARIIDCMIREQSLGVVRAVFDNTLDGPAFASDADFLNDPAELKSRLNELSHFVVCIGAEHGLARYQTARRLQDLGLKPIQLVHRKAFVEGSTAVGKGLQMMPGSIIHKFCTIGDQVIVNTNATIDHECVVGHGCHIMGSAAIAGNVTLEDFVTVGTNATILPDLRIGEGAYIGAGSVVTTDVKNGCIVAGVPAKLRNTNILKFDRKALDDLS